MTDEQDASLEQSFKKAAYDGHQLLSIWERSSVAKPGTRSKGWAFGEDSPTVP